MCVRVHSFSSPVLSDIAVYWVFYLGIGSWDVGGRVRHDVHGHGFCVALHRVSLQLSPSLLRAPPRLRHHLALSFLILRKSSRLSIVTVLGPALTISARTCKSQPRRTDRDDAALGDRSRADARRPHPAVVPPRAQDDVAHGQPREARRRAEAARAHRAPAPAPARAARLVEDRAARPHERRGRAGRDEGRGCVAVTVSGWGVDLERGVVG